MANAELKRQAIMESDDEEEEEEEEMMAEEDDEESEEEIKPAPKAIMGKKA